MLAAPVRQDTNSSKISSMFSCIDVAEVGLSLGFLAAVGVIDGFTVRYLGTLFIDDSEVFKGKAVSLSRHTHR